MKYYLIAGERSGDLHGSNLMKEIKKRDPDAEFRGFGGDYMQSAGLDIVIHYQDMAFMGLVALFLNLRTLLGRLKQCKEDILKYQPDVVILIDYGAFNKRIAKFCKANGVKNYYYISPKVWAWYQLRARELKRNVDRMFCILPFEKDFFKRFDWDVDYVGNPVLDAIKAFQPQSDFLQKNKIAASGHLVALLPGSRKSELVKIIPLMATVVEANPDYRFVVAAVRSMPEHMYRPLLRFSNVQIVFDETYDLLSHAHAAIVTSGTAALETGLFKVPQVVVYKANRFEYAIAKLMIKVQFVSLVNLILNREAIRELLQKEAKPINVIVELRRLVEDGYYRDRIAKDYEELLSILDTGSASENAARLMVGYLKGEG
ncbi:MAG: lipid-A-disaccharide synthase [Cyclobacteriaceae bacterium]